MKTQVYYLTVTAKRKNAKRHIVNKSTDIDQLRKTAQVLNKCYTREIYNGKWELVETID